MKLIKLAPLAACCLLLSACPAKEPMNPFPNPIVTPTPTPTPLATPSAVSSPGPLGPLQVLELANGDLVSDSFKLEFGPGSKGIKLEFGPGTKGPDGLEFGPGSKGPRTEFGPGTKGPQNLDFDITMPAGLTSTAVQPFSVQQMSVATPFLTQLKIEFIRENQLYATATVLPRRPEIKLDARFHPGTYTIRVLAQTGVGALLMSWSRIEVLPDFDTELKVSVFADPRKVFKPEDLDVEILSRNKVASDTDSPLISSPATSISPQPTPSPSVSAEASPEPSPEPSPSLSPEPSASPTPVSTIK